MSEKSSRFLGYFEAWNFVKDENESIDTVLALLQAMPSSVVRSMVVNFVKSLSNLTDDDYKIIQQLLKCINTLKATKQDKQDSEDAKDENQHHDQLQQTLSAKSHDNDINDKELGLREPESYEKQALNIELVICQIFQFLDYQSLLKCRRTNRQWLYESYSPLSIYHVSTANLWSSKVTWDHHRDANVRSYYFNHDLHFLSNIRSLTINEWPDFPKNEITKYLSNKVFLQFKKLENVKIIANEEEKGFKESKVWKRCFDIIGRMFYRNRHSINKVNISGVYPRHLCQWMTDILDSIEKINGEKQLSRSIGADYIDDDSVAFPKLTKLHFNNISLQSYPSLLMANVVSFSNNSWLSSMKKSTKMLTHHNNKASLGQSQSRRVLTMRSTHLDNAFFVGLLVEVAKYQSISMGVNDSKLLLLTDELILEDIFVREKDMTELKLTTLPILCNIGLNRVKYLKFWCHGKSNKNGDTLAALKFLPAQIYLCLSLHQVVVSYLLGKELAVGYPFMFQRKHQSHHKASIPPELRALNFDSVV